MFCPKTMYISQLTLTNWNSAHSPTLQRESGKAVIPCAQNAGRKRGYLPTIVIMSTSLFNVTKYLALSPFYRDLQFILVICSYKYLEVMRESTNSLCLDNLNVQIYKESYISQIFTTNRLLQKCS